MKVMVTGATGFIGSHLVEALLKEKHDVLCLVRGASSISRLANLDVRFLYGDLTDQVSLKQALNVDVDVVFHLAGLMGNWGLPDSVYWKINVDGTKNLLNVLNNSNVKQFIYSSTAGVLGPLEKPPADETFPLNPSNIYERTKAEAEKLVLSYYRETGFPVTVIRPEFIYGPGDMHTLGLFRSIKKRQFQLIGGGKSTLHPTFIDDLIQGFELCIDRKEAIGEVYLIAGEQYITVKELATKMAHALHVKSPKFYLPLWMANTLASLMETSTRLYDFQPPLTHSRVKFFTQNRGCDISKAKKQLEYKPMVNLEIGLKRTVDWYTKKGFL
jgi:nucleoside-diphosphate-sugar epimerase